ncbi:MAG: putative transcriptional regulator [Dactylosporangium sp.]|jgi:DNA-binding transcriptional MerR regulator|nr:putative transcriptional regulator [Dactylosporangium sp.]
MRIAELSEKTGVPVPTIKYYLREGLLPAGELSSPNQAHYNERHVERLRLVRALLDIGRLPIATIRTLLAKLDGPDPDLHNVLGNALKSSVVTREAIDPQAEREIDELIERRGWQVGPKAPARGAAAEVVAALRQLGADDLVALIDDYADAVERIATIDLEFVRHRAYPEAMVHGAVIGTILGDTLLAALRRLAQEHQSAKVFARPF